MSHTAEVNILIKLPVLKIFSCYSTALSAFFVYKQSRFRMNDFNYNL